METAVGAASWLVGKVIDKLSDELVLAYVASTELGLNAEQIKTDLMYTQGLLHEAQGRDDNPGLKGLLEQLSKKADEAEDALDELHYFIIQDQLDGTKYATPDLGGDLQAKVQHGRNAVHHTIGNWLQCFSCSPTLDDADCAATDVTETPPTTIKSDGGNIGGPVDKLTFDRVSMSNKIKSVLEAMHSKCVPVSDLLKIPSHSSTTVTTINLKRPMVGSTSVQDKLYGRDAIFEQTIKGIISGAYLGETLSVLPIVGPGGIGKTTFTQHMYNDKRTVDHFAVRVWVCVSTDFDVLKLTKQIHDCIPSTKKGENNTASASNNLDQLQIGIADKLKSKRFLIVLDDMWKCDSNVEWNTLLAPFMKGEAKGSMVLVTTRFPKIKELVKRGTNPVDLQGLDPEEFFEFFKACVFGENIPDQQYNELIDIGRKIAKKLKCSPLAAKTVARLLKKHLYWEHWSKVLENNEWQNETKDDNIMPALKISYDYLPFHLKQCFSFFSLFPEDYRFKVLEITHFWTAVGIVDSSYKNKNYLEELVDNGFLVKEVEDDLEDPCYVMHDLLHELSRIVSSQECANISSLSFSADDIPQSIRHLSITTVEDRYDYVVRTEMAKLKSRIDIGALRTLMIFPKYKGRIVDILNDTFSEIEGLRILFIVMNSPSSLPKNFPKLLHLRYLKIGSSYNSENILPSALARFYHLIFLDLKEWRGSSNLPKYINHLVNLRHFIAEPELHSNVPEVGKIKHLEELKEFNVKKESVGFELEELGRLTNLGGELRICNIQKVATMDEASKANLGLKRNLKILELDWGDEQWAEDVDVIDGLQLDCGDEQWAEDVDVIDGLQPHDSLRELTIRNHTCAVGPPSWLCRDISIKHLKSLKLYNISWCTLPPFGQLPCLETLELIQIAGVRHIETNSGTGRDKSFMHLKEVLIDSMPVLETWTMKPTCHLFPVLESIECKHCPNFLALPFLPDYSVSCTEDIHCPSLRFIDISDCPELLLPVMPPAPSLEYIEISDNNRSMCLELNKLNLKCYSGALAFHNMGNIVTLRSEKGSITSWVDLQKATSLRELYILEDSTIESMAFTSNLTSLTTLRLINCDKLTLDGFNTQIAVNLKKLVVCNDEDHPRSVAVNLPSEVARRTKQLPAGSIQLETLHVDSISAVLVAPVCSLLAATLNTLSICYDQRVESLTEEEEKSLQLLTSLQTLKFITCPGLPSLPQGLHSLSSLRDLTVLRCPGIQSLPKGGLPSSLNEIAVYECSNELYEQLMRLKETNPELDVVAYPKDGVTATPITTAVLTI